MTRECGICTYKYSCGYSSLRAGKPTGECCERHLFRKAQKNFWSSLNQRLESAEEIEAEEKR